MKKIISIFLVLLMLVLMFSFSFSTYAYSTSDDLAKFANEAIKEYDKENDVNTPTYTYYFLKPDGKSGLKPNDESKFAPSWDFEEYTIGGPGIYWHSTKNVPNPDSWCGYKFDSLVEETSNVYKCTVPQSVSSIIINNGFDSPIDNKELSEHAFHSIEIPSTYYAEGENPYIPEGTDNFDNMIWVVDPDSIISDEITSAPICGGHWFYYYGNECFGTVKNPSHPEKCCMNKAHNHKENLFKDLFIKNKPLWNENCQYQEIYYHFDRETGELDWTLLFAMSDMCIPWFVYGNFGNVIIAEYNEYIPFSLTYGIFDSKKQTFMSLEKAYNNLSSYKDLETYVDKHLGTKIGDINNDKDINILDALMIQKCLVEITHFPESDTIEGYCLYGNERKYISDFNLDGERDIMDATAIQKHIANIE